MLDIFSYWNQGLRITWVFVQLFSVSCWARGVCGGTLVQIQSRHILLLQKTLRLVVISKKRGVVCGGPGWAFVLHFLVILVALVGVGVFVEWHGLCVLIYVLFEQVGSDWGHHGLAEIGSEHLAGILLHSWLWVEVLGLLDVSALYDYLQLLLHLFLQLEVLQILASVGWVQCVHILISAVLLALAQSLGSHVNLILLTELLKVSGLLEVLFVIFVVEVLERT